LNPNLQLVEVGWTNQTILCFLQVDVVFDVIIVKDYNLMLIDAPVFIKLRQSQVLHHDNFVRFKVTCKGPHKFGITKQLDNTFR
jgi:hypothetical protein